MSIQDTGTIEHTKPRFRRGDGKPSTPQPQTIRYHRGEKAKRITGPFSRAIDRGALGTINGSTREGRFLRSYERMLIEHVGGNPSITQRALISRTARLALHLELMDEKALKNGDVFGPTHHHFYVSWSNSLARHLEKIGFKSSSRYGRNTSLPSIVAEASL